LGKVHNGGFSGKRPSLAVSEISGRVGGPRDGDIESDKDPDFEHVDIDAGRWLRRRHAAGVAVVTTVAGGHYRGSTISDWMVVSAEPVQILLAVDADGQMADWLQSARYFAVSILPWSAQFQADQFAGFTPRAASDFAGIDHFVAASGAPVLVACIAWADCTVAGTVVTGDHLCFVGDVSGFGRGIGDEGNPLTRYLSRYHRLR
jgi:flavin reductase (DIM6/NTAB) family NADH-FMN oxidoreductase RutF